MRNALIGFLPLVAGGALLAAILPVHADNRGAPEEPAAYAARLRAEIRNLPYLVRSTPNIYLVRVESIETADLEDTGAKAGRARAGAGGRPPEKVTAVVRTTLKGQRAKKLTLIVRQRPPDAASAELIGGGLSSDSEKLQHSPIFFSPARFLSPRNPILGGPLFEENKLYVLFMDGPREQLLGGPYGYQPVSSDTSFWMQTVRHLIAHPGSEHAISMDFRDFVKKHRSAFLMASDCLGTEVSISEPLWGDAVSRKDIDPGRILPENAADCSGALDRKRGYLGLIEAEPWLYQARHGYPNQIYVELHDDMLDFSELGLDIGFPDGGRISVTELAERLSAH